MAPPDHAPRWFFSSPEIAQVIASYAATGPEQLTLAPGQLILIRRKNPGGWWEGELQVRGESGRVVPSVPKGRGLRASVWWPRSTLSG